MTWVHGEKDDLDESSVLILFSIMIVTNPEGGKGDASALLRPLGLDLLDQLVLLLRHNLPVLQQEVDEVGLRDPASVPLNIYQRNTVNLN